MPEVKFPKCTLLGGGERGRIGKTAADDLLILRLIRHLPAETPALRVFLDTVSAPPLSPEAVVARQETLRVFLTHPSLLDGLEEVSARLAQIRQNWDSERAKFFTVRRLSTGDKTTEFYNARLSLQLTARYLKLTLMTLDAVRQLIDRYHFEAPALSALRDACARAATGAAYRRVWEMADRVELGILEATSYEVEGTLDDEGRLTAPILADFRFMPASPPRRGGEGGLFSALFRTKSEARADAPPPATETSYLNEFSSEASYDLLLDAAGETERRMLSIARALLASMESIPRELSFYRVAFLYCRRMADRGVTMVFPEILPEAAHVAEARALRDPILLSEAARPASVVASDLDLSGGGMLIRGPNGSGKTVFLRAASLGVLFGLSGLPIPADSARFSIRRGIFTHFAAAEAALSEASAAGRFEEEVAALAAVLDELTPSSLLLLNETFQSTSYPEGAAGIAPVLEHILALGGNFLFVTHLTELFTLYRDTPGIVLCSSSGEAADRYRIRPLGGAAKNI